MYNASLDVFLQAATPVDYTTVFVVSSFTWHCFPLPTPLRYLSEYIRMSTKGQ